MWYAIGFVLLVFVMGLYHVVTGDGLRDKDNNPIVVKGYLSDEDYLNSHPDNKIVYHWYGRTRE